jgi:hypothetical protein
VPVWSSTDAAFSDVISLFRPRSAIAAHLALNGRFGPFRDRRRRTHSGDQAMVRGTKTEEQGVIKTANSLAAGSRASQDDQDVEAKRGEQPADLDQ